MLSPDFAFSIGGLITMLSWLGLSASLFLGVPWRSGVWTATTIFVPALLGLAYVFLIAEGLDADTGGGFGSIEAVRRLFSDDAALTAGWLHYLAFDLFAGSWIAREGLDADISKLLILPCLLLTFLAGPAGLLVFLILRFFVAGRIGLAARRS